MIALKRSEGEFFSYASRASRPVKFVLSGLDHYVLDDVIKELNNNNIGCCDVKYMEVKNKRFEKQTNYLVYFKKGMIKFSELKKCRTLFNTIVSWSHWRKKPNSVTQCYRCQMFGHGEDHCHLQPNCQICGGTHLTAACTARNKLRCSNRGQAHKSPDANCPKRAEYLSLLNKLKNRSHSARKPVNVVNNFVNEPNLFLTLARNSHVITSNVNNVKPNLSYSNVTRSHVIPNTHNELFTSTELITT